MSSKCYTHYMHLAKLDAGVKQEIFVPVRCKSWGCESCRLIKARLVMSFIQRVFAGQSLFMLTFTDPHKGAAVDAWRSLGCKWNLFRTWATKKYGKFQYVRIIEPHKKGAWPHMHVLVNVDMGDASIRARLKNWGFGYIFDKMEISVKGASQYVSGYLTKKWPGNQANYYRQVTRTRIVQASQSLGAIFSFKSDWSLVSREILNEDVGNYVWDIYKARFINHKTGASLLSQFEYFVIESIPLKSDVEFFRNLGAEKISVSVEEAEPVAIKLIGLQQSLLLER